MLMHTDVLLRTKDLVLASKLSTLKSKPLTLRSKVLTVASVIWTLKGRALSEDFIEHAIAKIIHQKGDVKRHGLTFLHTTSYGRRM
jgi:hypothetical protein